MTTANPNGRVFWAGLLLILAAFTATAQEFRGSLAGKITDPNGAVVPGSKVEIKNIETGIVSTAITGEDGSLQFPSAAARQVSTHRDEGKLQHRRSRRH